MAPSRRNIGIESPGVNAAVVKKDNDGWKFLILKRSETETYGGMWGFVTGGKRDNETVGEVVLREMREETGLVPTKLWATEYVIQFYEPENDKIWILPLIVAVVPPDCKVKLSEENAEFDWLPADKAVHRVSWKNLERAIADLAEELELYPAKNWVAI